MEKESFFTKLRRLGTTVENETANLEENMKKPIGLRSSENHRSSQLVLKEMLHDANNVKKEARQTLHTVTSETSQFQNIVAAVQTLCREQKVQVQEFEDYLQQYGYQLYQQPQQKKDKKIKQSNKENVPVDDECAETKCAPIDEKKEEPTSDVKVHEETNNFATPPKSSHSILTDCDGGRSRTPQLSDFGLSQVTLDRFAAMNMPQSWRRPAPPESVQATPAKTDRTYNISTNQSVPYGYPPMTTPKFQQLIPFSQDTVMVTPGIFGNRVVPNNTPEHFLDSALPKPNLDDSPIPPILSTVKKWPKTASHMLPPRLALFNGEDQGPPSPELPQPPDMTIAWNEIIPAAPQLHNPSDYSSTNVTPPMPVFLSSQITTMPSAPTPLATKYESSSMPQEPIQLANQTQCGEEMPSRPVLLAEKLGVSSTMPTEPVQLASMVDVGTPPEPVLLTQRFGARHYVPAQPNGLPETASSTGLNGNTDMPTPQQQSATATPQQPPVMAQVATWQGQQMSQAPTVSQHYQNTGMMSQNTMASSQFTVGSGVADSQSVVGLGHGVTPQKAAPWMRLQEEDMPQTPELTMTYKRFVDIKPPCLPNLSTNSSSSYPQTNYSGAPATPVQRVAPYQLQTHRDIHSQDAAGAIPTDGNRAVQITSITPLEFNGVQDYLQRILPLHVINGHIETLNQILCCKPDSSYITEEETKIVDLGPKLRVMLLLMCKLKRWEKKKSPETNESVFYIL